MPEPPPPLLQPLAPCTGRAELGDDLVVQFPLPVRQVAARARRGHEGEEGDHGSWVVGRGRWQCRIPDPPRPFHSHLDPPAGGRGRVDSATRSSYSWPTKSTCQTWAVAMNCANCGGGLQPVGGAPTSAARTAKRFTSRARDRRRGRRGSAGTPGTPARSATDPLATAAVGGHPVCYCRTCRGFLAGNATFGRIVRLRRAEHGSPAHTPVPFTPDELKRRVQRRLCCRRHGHAPVPRGRERRTTPASRCHLVWLDAGELTVLGRYPGCVGWAWGNPRPASDPDAAAEPKPVVHLFGFRIKPFLIYPRRLLHELDLRRVRDDPGPVALVEQPADRRPGRGRRSRASSRSRTCRRTCPPGPRPCRGRTSGRSRSASSPVGQAVPDALLQQPADLAHRVAGRGPCGRRSRRAAAAARSSPATTPRGRRRGAAPGSGT